MVRADLISSAPEAEMNGGIRSGISLPNSTGILRNSNSFGHRSFIPGLQPFSTSFPLLPSSFGNGNGNGNGGAGLSPANLYQLVFTGDIQVVQPPASSLFTATGHLRQNIPQGQSYQQQEQPTLNLTSSFASFGFNTPSGSLHTLATATPASASVQYHLTPIIPGHLRSAHNLARVQASNSAAANVAAATSTLGQQARLSSEAAVGHSAQLQRHKVTVNRQPGRVLLRQAEAILGQLKDSHACLEIAFDGEVGFGLGPTLEFYTLVSRQLMHASLGLWYGNETTEDGFVVAPTPGLFPRPLTSSRKTKASTFKEVRAKFIFLGRLMARALLDLRQLDMPLSPLFFRAFLSVPVEAYSSSSETTCSARVPKIKLGSTIATSTGTYVSASIHPTLAGHYAFSTSDLALLDPQLARHHRQLRATVNKRIRLVKLINRIADQVESRQNVSPPRFNHSRLHLQQRQHQQATIRQKQSTGLVSYLPTNHVEGSASCSGNSFLSPEADSKICTPTRIIQSTNSDEFNQISYSSDIDSLAESNTGEAIGNQILEQERPQTVLSESSTGFLPTDQLSVSVYLPIMDQPEGSSVSTFQPQSTQHRLAELNRHLNELDQEVEELYLNFVLPGYGASGFVSLSFSSFSIIWYFNFELRT
ncbi:unnamed protein product [Protopolystoma xenopodis]|uniref:E3 ubiquitin-protein ligase n=1 Tax=Protopolystoma xenopodis TaxID=117903 RepID=A0A3S5B3V8_9PLAT|nr:unnamed protein product [Protopolystoma xenopodis]